MGKEEQSYSKIQWFIMVFLIPIIFATILFGFLLNFMGVDLARETKEILAKVPVLSNILETEEEEQIVEGQQTIEGLVTEVSERQAEVDSLKQELTVKEEEISTLKSEIERLQAELEDVETNQIQTQQEFKEITKLYESMSAKNAANILQELPTQDAALHLQHVKVDVRASILSKMAPEKAAELIANIVN